MQLVHPRRQHRERADDQVRAVHASYLRKRGEERDGLERLTESHLVGEDAAAPVVEHPDEPPDTFQLVLPQHRFDRLGLVIHGD